MFIFILVTWYSFIWSLRNVLRALINVYFSSWNLKLLYIIPEEKCSNSSVWLLRSALRASHLLLLCSCSRNLKLLYVTPEKCSKSFTLIIICSCSSNLKFLHVTPEKCSKSFTLIIICFSSSYLKFLYVTPEKCSKSITVIIIMF